jgi:hypothetical protein
LDTVFDDILGATKGDSVVYSDGTDSWLFVTGDTTAGYNAGDDYVVKLVGVIADSVTATGGSIYIDGTASVI